MKKKLKDLLKGLPHEAAPGAGDVAVSGVSFDSRRVKPGDLFVALKGNRQDGHDFVAAVAAAGAAAVVVERPVDSPVPAVLVPSTLAALSALAARFHGNPSARMQVVGVTGTNGKTTTTYMIEGVVKTAKASPGVIGTVEYRWTGKTEKAPNTTPFAADLQALLARMRTDGVTHVAMEVSSHALELHRVDDMTFAAAVFTNLTRDHLDFHGTMENYFEAKAKLFDMLGAQKGAKSRFAIINIDDPWSEKLLARLKTDRLTYGVRQPADLHAQGIELTAEGTSFTLTVAARPGPGPSDRTASGKRHPMRLQTVGLHNVYNALAATGACLALGLDMAVIKKGLAGLTGVPGRLERVPWPGSKTPFSVFVDYAHTDDALKNVLEALKPLTKGKLITVFGCGGDRDRTKRPLMGETAAKLSDRVIVTSDNPRTEEPAKITLDIEVGLRRAGATNYEIVLQREEAIEKAVRAARPGDVVLIAGKGHETYQIFKDRTIDFDDRVVAREALKRL